MGDAGPMGVAFSAHKGALPVGQAHIDLCTGDSPMIQPRVTANCAAGVLLCWCLLAALAAPPGAVAWHVGAAQKEAALSGAALPRNVIIVDWDGTGDYVTIQEALDASTNGDTIVVAPSGPSPAGAYVENIVFPAKAVTLRSVDPDDPAIVTATVIDGNASGSVVTFTAGTTPDALLEGLTIRNGSATEGGGIYCSASSPTIDGCTITENTAVRGGGIYSTGSSPRVTYCTITQNAATGYDSEDGGGGMANYDGSHPTAIGCTFVYNTAPRKGGGMSSFRDSGPTLIDCLFHENTATAASGMGGGMYGNESGPVITRCAFVGNVARWAGGLRETYTDAALTDCVFIGNTADGPYWARGGGLEGAGGNLRATNCAFIANRAAGSSGHSAGAALGTMATLTNCVFFGNVAEGTDFGVGGLLVYDDWEATLTNCVFSANRSVFGAGETAQIYFEMAVVVINYSCVQGWTGAFGGVGNHGFNPLLTKPEGADGVSGTADDDVRLRPGSPCIDAGDNEADTNTSSNGLQPLPDTDLAGNPRFVDDPSTFPDPGYGTPPIVDMGPYEYQPDCNSNGVLDVDDLAAGTSQDCNATGIPDECDIADGLSADCNTNGVPDECDLAGGTSEDCQDNGIPDECEVDCNGNGTPDDCDISAGTSEDCQRNGTPDECDLERGLSADCNSNAVPDPCDIADMTSEDCQPNGAPDECELAGNDCNSNEVPDDCDRDCNTNGVPDDCDLAAGTSEDCNSNGRPDECDVTRCASVWDGFPMNDPPDPFQYNQPLSEIDYNGDGIYWDNPAGTAVIDLYGCNVYPPDRFDFSVRVSVPSSGDPEDGYVASEYFETESGELGPEEDIYSLSFYPRVQGVTGDTAFNHKYDWQYFIYDAASGGVVVQIEFVSTESTRVPTSQRGKILVKDPEGGYYDTGVPLLFQEEAGRTWTACFDIEAMLDNRDGIVKVYVDGELKVETTRLNSNARRMDYFHLQAVGNLASTSGDTSFRLDRVDLCLTGRVVSPGVYDCNGNGVLDECDITGGTSADCNANGIPDECEMGDFDDDGEVGLTDYQTFQSCFTGPDGGPLDAGCELGDFDCDDDIDLADFAAFQEAFTG